MDRGCTRGHDQLEAVAPLWESGLPVSEISRHTGLSDCRVRRIASDRGLARPFDRDGSPLRPRPAAVLAFVQDYTARCSCPPTLREIVAGCGLSSTSVALYNLRLLVNRGYLTRIPGAARGVVLTELGWSWVPSTEREA